MCDLVCARSCVIAFSAMMGCAVWSGDDQTDSAIQGSQARQVRRDSSVPELRPDLRLEAQSETPNLLLDLGTARQFRNRAARRRHPCRLPIDRLSLASRAAHRRGLRALVGVFLSSSVLYMRVRFGPAATILIPETQQLLAAIGPQVPFGPAALLSYPQGVSLRVRRGPRSPSAHSAVRCRSGAALG